MGSNKRGKPFQPKRKPSINMVAVASSSVAKLAPDTVRGLAESFGRSMTLLHPYRRRTGNFAGDDRDAEP